MQKNIQENLNYLSSQKENLPEELYLTLENNLILEKINFTPETNESKKEIYLLINNQSVKNDLFIKDKNIIGIFDLDNTTVKKATIDYIDKAEKNGECVTVSYEELPKSFIVTTENDKKKIYISPLNTSTIFKRIK